jgi:hypothetical protein
MYSRQFLIFPALISTVATLVFVLGADALSLTMNTVALLLILDLDDLILKGVLSRSLYEDVANEFRMELDERRAAEVYSARYVHILGPMIAIPFSVYKCYEYLLGVEVLSYYPILASIYQFSVCIAENGLRRKGLTRALFSVCYQVIGIFIYVTILVAFVVFTLYMDWTDANRRTFWVMWMFIFTFFLVVLSIATCICLEVEDMLLEKNTNCAVVQI